MDSPTNKLLTLRKLLAAGMILLLFCEAKAAETVGSELPVSFELDVQPVLTVAGCNTGACHGKQRGQNGFQLSLLAFDSDFDFDAIAVSARGRRLFLPVAEESLLLRKAIAAEPHGGGQRFAVDSYEYRTLHNWISQGAQRRIADEASLITIELSSESISLEAGASARIEVVAVYSDESRRNVTQLATYLSNDDAVAKVSDEGRITAGTIPGETAIMVRYMNHIRVVEVLIPYGQQLPPDHFASMPRSNFIDDLIYDKLQKTSIEPSLPIDEAVFLRRVYTDLIGRMPTAQEARDYLTSSDDNRREQLVERLLNMPEYVDYWANQWMDLLRPNPYRVGIKAVFNYDNWIRQQFRDNVSYDRFVHDLVTAEGSTWRNGAVTLFRDRRTPDEMATMVSQLFLGIRLECAKCHHHPFENWSQEDFYQFAAFFSQVKHKGTGLSPPISGGEESIISANSGVVKHPNTGAIMEPKPLYGSLMSDRSNQGDLRQQLSGWITSTDNPYFAKVQVNRVWAALMGRGFVEPVDDLRSTNPPSNALLLDALADFFQQSGYDLKQVLKLIVLSRTYALSSTPNESNVQDRVNYSRHYRHQFRAEVLLDSIAQITETPNEMRGMPVGSRATQIWTHRVDSLFLDTFGRPDENQDPPCERIPDSTVTQALHLMNSRELDRRVRSDQGRAARLAKSQLSSAEIVEELYLAIYSRFPQPNEQAFATSLFDVGTNDAQQHRRAVTEDLMWAMLNSPEYLIQN
ncbi:MAG: DUF1553 domain-containing protein [Planctomycetales bacterium]|nr:DUF1553 domain-containing protein [Planctomycetales bacterium]